MPLRNGTSDDRALLARLHTESWRSAYLGILTDVFLSQEVEADRAAVWDLRMANPRPDQQIFIAENEQGPLGFICLFGQEDAGFGVYVDNLHVRPDGKRQGTGVVLMKRAAQWAQENYPGEGMYLWVYEANGNARRFYERLGAENYERVDLPGADGRTAPALRYVWRTVDPILSWHPERF